MVGLLFLTCLVGLGGLFWNRVPGTVGPHPVQPGGVEVQSFDLEVQGEFAGISPTRLREARVTLYFPQMPFQVTRRWAQLEHPKENSFRVPLKFQTECPASLCVLRLQMGDKNVNVGKVQVQSGDRMVTFPTARVRI